MKNKATSMICAASLAAFGVASAAAQGLVERCDKPMAAANFMAEAVTKCGDSLAKGNVSRTSTVTPSDTSQVWIDVPAGKIPDAIKSSATKEGTLLLLIKSSATKEGMLLLLNKYYSYAAYTANDPSKCAPLKFLFASMEKDCITKVQLLQMQHSWFGPQREFINACGQIGDSELKMSAQCCSLAYSVKDSANPCAKLTPSCIRDPRICEALTRSLTTDASICRKSSTHEGASCKNPEECDEDYTLCLGDIAYGRAARSKDLGTCGANDRCRVLMGDGARVVQEVGVQLGKSPAGRWFVNEDWKRAARVKGVAPKNAPARRAAPASLPSDLPGFTCQAPIGTPANRRVANDLLTGADACLNTIESVLQPSDFDLFLEIDGRRETLARLRIRVKRYFDGEARASARTPARSPRRSK